MEAFETFGVWNVREIIPGGIVRPLKIGWRSIHENIQNQAAHFRKPEDYHRWKESIRQAEGAGVGFTTPSIDEPSFRHFYNFYCEQMKKIPQGRVTLPESWLRHHQEKGHQTVAYFAWQESQLVGGMIGFVDTELAALHIGFLAVDHTYPGVTAGLQRELLQDLMQKRLGWIYYGKDTNLYGPALSLGLIFNKIRFGLTPFLPPETEIVTSFILEKPKILPMGIFTPTNNGSFNFLLISEEPVPNLKQYVAASIVAPENRLIQDIIPTHQSIFESLQRK